MLMGAPDFDSIPAPPKATTSAEWPEIYGGSVGISCEGKGTVPTAQVTARNIGLVGCDSISNTQRLSETNIHANIQYPRIS